MRKSAHLKRMVSVLLLLAMLLTLCSCGERKEQPAAAEAPEATAASEVKQSADNDMVDDPVIQAHIQSNQEVAAPKEKDRPVDQFHFYITNNDTMTGLVSDRKVTLFQDSLQCVFDAAHSQVDDVTAHYLSRAAGSEELEWTSEAWTEYLLRSIQSPGFYQENPLPAVGPLSSMFKQDKDPFEENGLTLIVSNFEEPGFDLNALSVGIETYFDTYAHSAACVIGMRLPYQGELGIPNHTISKESTTFLVRNFTGDVPCYMVVVGPDAAVRSYTENLFTYLDGRGINCSSALYSNSVYEQLMAPVLSFDVVADTKEKKLESPVLSSYNTGKLAEHEKGGAYFATYTSVETSDGRTMDPNYARISRSTQIALVSSNYDKVSDYPFEYQLFQYDEASGQWIDAGKNPTTMAYVKLMPMTTEETYNYNDKVVVLAEGREEMYLCAQLNFEDETILSRDQVYRLEVRIRLNRDNPDAQSESRKTDLKGFSIGSSDYYNMITSLCRVPHGNFVWTGPKNAPEQDIRRALVCTPNLDAFLTRLENLEEKYQSANEVVQYVDFIFNMPNTGSKR